MNTPTLIKTGKRGTLVLPRPIQKKFSLKGGDFFFVEEKDGGIFLQPIFMVPTEIYSEKQKAEFLLSNAVTKEELDLMKEEVQKMGVSLDSLTYFSPWK